MKVSATKSPERGRVRVLTDNALVAAMRAGDDWAWAEFDIRFRARLEQYIRYVGPRRSHWDECITEVIEDAALKLTSASVVVPTNLTAYLIRAARNRIRTIERAAMRRHKRYVEASAVNEPEGVVWSVCSESALRASHVTAGDVGNPASAQGSRVRRQLAVALLSDLSDEERCIVAWVTEVVPYRQIAAWLGASYDATSKRIWRLLRRLRQRALAHATALNAAERTELERLFRRVGLERVPASAAAAHRCGGNNR